MKNTNNYKTVGTYPKSIRKRVVTKGNSIPLTQTCTLYDRPLSWIDTETSMKSGGVKLVLWA